MRTLPKELTHAQALQTLWPEDLFPFLSELIERLGRALGGLPTAAITGNEEPDGYDGLGREPNYERLLLSEWLLAEEAPDEFVRRASTGEHSFLALSRQSPHSRRRCYVMFDAGPFSLGMPRIVALASLMALERRALKADAEFHWGVLGAEGPLRETLTSHEDARAFLSARSAIAPTLADLQRAHTPESGDELWVVGSFRACDWAAGKAHTVSLGESLDARAVAAEVRLIGRSPRTLTLPMPTDALCIKLLRDPFAKRSESGTPARVPVGRSFSFGGRGYRLLEIQQRTLFARSIPAHPGAAPGKPKTFQVPEGERLLAAAYPERLVALTASDASVQIYGVRPEVSPDLYQGRHRLTCAFSGGAELKVETTPGSCALLEQRGLVIAIVPLQNRSTLMVGIRDTARAYVVLEHTVGVAEGGRAGQAVWLTSRGDLLELRVQKRNSIEWDTVARLELPTPDEVFFACPRERSDAMGGFVGIRHGARMRMVEIRPAESPLRSHDLFVPTGARVVGMFLSRGEETLQLVVLSRDSKTLERIGRKGSECLIQSAAPIERVQVCPVSSVIAYGSLHQTELFCMRRKRVLWVLDHRERTS